MRDMYQGLRYERTVRLKFPLAEIFETAETETAETETAAQRPSWQSCFLH